MRVLIVGGTGFIGRNLVSNFGPAVRVLVHETGPDWLPAGSETVRGDVLDAASLDRAVAGMDVVVNLTGQEGGNSSHVREINRVGSTLLAEAAVKAGVQRLVHFSTAQVYGECEMAEETTPVSPASPYAADKLAAEQAVERFAGTGTLTVLRLTNVYGPFQYKGFFGRLIAATQGGPPVVVNGDGGQRRDFVYVGDVVRAATSLAVGQARPGIINVGSGETRTLVEVMNAAAAVLGKQVPCEWRPSANVGLKANGVSIAKARLLLGVQPTDLMEGLALTLAPAATGGER